MRNISLTGNSRDKAKGPQHAKGSKGLDVKPSRFASGLAARVGVFGYHLQNHAEQPGDDERERERGGGRRQDSSQGNVSKPKERR